MAYCKKCGAYIPDGETKCLACGYDENEKNVYGASSSARNARQETHYSNTEDSERFKQKMDEQREKQSENYRKWAEAERERRRQQEEVRRRAEAQRTATEPPTRSYSDPSSDSTVSETSRRMGIISYLGGLWLIPMLLFHEDKFAMYHAKQGLILSIAGLIAGGIGEALHVGWIVTIARIYMIVKGISNANDKKMEPLPYIGDIVSKN